MYVGEVKFLTLVYALMQTWPHPCRYHMSHVHMPPRGIALEGGTNQSIARCEATVSMVVKVWPVGLPEVQGPHRSQAGTKRASNKHLKNKVNLVCRFCKATCLGCKLCSTINTYT